MSFTVAIINQKGGVGKTATAYNLAYSFSQNKKRTLLVDLDPSANATRGLISHYDELDLMTVTDLLLDRKADAWTAVVPSCIHGEEQEFLKVIPSEISLAKVQRQIINYPYKEALLHNHLEKLKDGFDFTLIDCSPTLTDLTINAIYAADFFIVPIQYEKDAFEGMADLFEIIDEIKQERGFNYRILRNGLDARKKTVLKVVNELLSPFMEKGAVFNTIIRRDEEVVKAKMNNEPVFTFSKCSPAIEDYKKLTMEVMDVQRDQG